MSYTIDIIDTTDNDVALSLEHAAAKSLVLSWNGSDTREPGIVSSSFKFTMVDAENNDGLFDALYTGNETKYKVNILHDASTKIIWQGFLLPDLYSEPYTNNIVTVDFEATDALGRLKGKYLDVSFYEDEKSVIEIIAACLNATGLELGFYFLPAIENALVKDYNAIYINTENHLKTNKQQDAYTILNTLLEDMLCVLYQADNRWYIEGINTRQQKVVNYKSYDALGVYVEAIEFTRLLKAHKALVTPFVTVVPPFGIVSVSHEQIAVGLPKTIAQEANDGWAVPPGTLGEILPTNWIGSGGYEAFAVAYEYYIRLYASFGKTLADLDTTRYVSLKEKIYVAAGSKFNFSLGMDLKLNTLLDSDETVDSNYYENGTLIEISVNGDLVKSSPFVFAETEKSKTLEFDFIIDTAGLLDIKIYKPFLAVHTRVARSSGFVFNKVALTKLNNTEDVYVEQTANDEFTLTKDVALIFGDDASGISVGFQLAKIKAITGNYSVKEVKVKYGITYDDSTYAVVDLYGANMIADNIKTVYYDGVLLTDLEVIYNFNDAEEMVVKTASLFSVGDVFEVYIYTINDIEGNRDAWERWTDVIYQIEKNRYAQVVADIYTRMHNVAHFKLDMTLNRSLKFNDLLTFPYKLDQDYVVTNCSWNIDDNTTTVTAIKGYYLNDVVINPDDNIPPIVDAGDDLLLEVSDTKTGLLAVATDPDGFIVSYLWEQVSGEFDAVIVASTEPDAVVFGLIGEGDYVFRVTVTDNDGATAFDEVTIRKELAYSVLLTPYCLSDRYEAHRSGGRYFRRKLVNVTVAPSLPVGTVITLFFNVQRFTIATGSLTGYDDYVNTAECVNITGDAFIPNPDGGRDIANPDYISGNIRIIKNTAVVYGGPEAYQNDIVPVSFITGTDLKIQLDHFFNTVFSGLYEENFRVVLTDAVANNGAVVTGYPQTVNVYDGFEYALKTPVIDTAEVVSTTQIKLELDDFNSDSSETIRIYIEYCLNDGNENWLAHGDIARTATSYSVTGLTAGTDYKFRCKSVVTLDTFESQYSNIVTQNT